MKLQKALVPALSASAALAYPLENQIPLSVKSAVSQAFSAFGFGLESNSLLNTVTQLWNGDAPKEKNAASYSLKMPDGRTFIAQDGMSCEWTAADPWIVTRRLTTTPYNHR